MDANSTVRCTSLWVKKTFLRFLMRNLVHMCQQAWRCTCKDLQRQFVFTLVKITLPTPSQCLGMLRVDFQSNVAADTVTDGMNTSSKRSMQSSTEVRHKHGQGSSRSTYFSPFNTVSVEFVPELQKRNVRVASHDNTCNSFPLFLRL